MTAQTKHNINGVGIWVFRSILSACCVIMTSLVIEMRADIKVLMEERSGLNENVIHLDKRVDKAETNIENLYSRLVNHEINHK